MMQLTEEQKAAMIERIGKHVAWLKGSAFNQYNDHAVIQEEVDIYSIALASLAAEPVGYIHNTLNPSESAGIFAEENRHYGRAVYAAPPAPALRLPDEYVSKTFAEKEWAKEDGWNACLAEVKRLNATAPQPVKLPAADHETEDGHKYYREDTIVEFIRAAGLQVEE